MLNTEGTQGFQEWQVYYFVRTSNPINGEGNEEANDRYFVTRSERSLMEHEEDKARLVQETGLQLKQINNWFINQRKRNWHNNPSSSSIISKNKCKRSNTGNR
ncbi:hypothetical protein ACS0TY_013559 [Phlomoides rotata]